MLICSSVPLACFVVLVNRCHASSCPWIPLQSGSFVSCALFCIFCVAYFCKSVIQFSSNKPCLEKRKDKPSKVLSRALVWFHPYWAQKYMQIDSMSVVHLDKISTIFGFLDCLVCVEHSKMMETHFTVQVISRYLVCKYQTLSTSTVKPVNLKEKSSQNFLFCNF